MRDRQPAVPGLTGLEIIAGFKFLQAAALIAAGLGAFGLMNAGVADAAQVWLSRLALGKGQSIAAAAAARTLPFLRAATPRHFGALGAGALLYALVFLVEGVGLWRGKRWAEYLTIAVTTSLLPFEAAAVWQRITTVRVATLAVNALVVAYLVWQLRARSRLEAEQAAADAAVERAAA
jgi:uncharacterized membrane protein (DUF2068 family)